MCHLTANPTAPRPNIATEDPGSTFASFHAAPTPAILYGHDVKSSVFPSQLQVEEVVQTSMSFAAPTSGGPAAEEAGEGRRQGRIDLDGMVDVHDGVLGEAGHAQEVVERAPLGVAEPGGAVARHPRAHREPVPGAHVAPRRAAVHAALAAAALPQERRHHRVAGGELLHVFPDALHHPAHRHGHMVRDRVYSCCV